MLDPDREIYPNAPLKLVAFEIKYAEMPRLESEQWEEVYDALREDLPILGPRPGRELTISPSGSEEKYSGRRLMDRVRTQAASLFDGATTFETSNYRRFEDFSSFVRRLLEVIDEIGTIPSVQRLGLRYIDEVKNPDPESSGVDGWTRFIAEHLLAPTATSHRVSAYRVNLNMNISDHHTVGFRYGVLHEPIVDPKGPLRIADSPEGEYFLLDLDSFWSAPDDEFPEFEIDDVMDHLEALHAPIRDLFEESITEDLRKWMRGESHE